MVRLLRTRNWVTAARMALALLAMNIWQGCEKSPVSHGENPAPVPITSDVKWQVIFSDPRAKFPPTSGLAFDSSGTFGFAIGEQTYRTTDGGRSWIMMPLGFGGGLRVTSKTVAYQLGPFQRTSDAGETWHRISTPANSGILVHGTGDVFFFLVLDTLGTWWHKVECWKTENGGISWTKMGTPDGAIFDVTTADGIALVLTFQASPNGPISLYYSRDGGTSWIKSYIDTLTDGTGWSFLKAKLLSAKNGVSVAWRPNVDRQFDLGIFRTTDGGATWNKVYQALLGSRYGGAAIDFVLARSPRLLLRVIVDDVRFHSHTYISDDDGLTWIPAGTWFDTSQPYSYYTPTFAPPDWRIGISGPWMTQDGGKTWNQKSWYVANAAFLNAYEVIGVRDSVILRGTAP